MFNHSTITDTFSASMLGLSGQENGRGVSSQQDGDFAAIFLALLGTSGWSKSAGDSPSPLASLLAGGNLIMSSPVTLSNPEAVSGTVAGQDFTLFQDINPDSPGPEPPTGGSSPFGDDIELLSERLSLVAAKFGSRYRLVKNPIETPAPRLETGADTPPSRLNADAFGEEQIRPLDSWSAGWLPDSRLVSASEWAGRVETGTGQQMVAFSEDNGFFQVGGAGRLALSGRINGLEARGAYNSPASPETAVDLVELASPFTDPDTPETTREGEDFPLSQPPKDDQKNEFMNTPRMNPGRIMSAGLEHGQDESILPTIVPAPVQTTAKEWLDSFTQPKAVPVPTGPAKDLLGDLNAERFEHRDPSLWDGLLNSRNPLAVARNHSLSAAVQDGARRPDIKFGPAGSGSAVADLHLEPGEFQATEQSQTSGLFTVTGLDLARPLAADSAAPVIDVPRFEDSGRMMTEETVRFLDSFQGDSGEYRATFRLHPPQLGEVALEMNVRLKKVELRLNVENSEVRGIIETSLHGLKAALNDKGYTLTQCDVFVPNHQNSSAGGRDSHSPNGGFVSTPEITIDFFRVEAQPDVITDSQVDVLA
jgi:hypothetical protein